MVFPLIVHSNSNASVNVGAFEITLLLEKRLLTSSIVLSVSIRNRFLQPSGICFNVCPPYETGCYSPETYGTTEIQEPENRHIGTLFKRLFITLCTYTYSTNLIFVHQLLVPYSYRVVCNVEELLVKSPKLQFVGKRTLTLRKAYFSEVLVCSNARRNG